MSGSIFRYFRAEGDVIVIAIFIYNGYLSDRMYISNIILSKTPIIEFIARII